MSRLVIAAVTLLLLGGGAVTVPAASVPLVGIHGPVSSHVPDSVGHTALSSRTGEPSPRSSAGAGLSTAVPGATTGAIVRAFGSPGGNWTNLTSTLKTGPSARDNESFAYDPAAGYSVLFGGQGVMGQFFNDTWIFRNGSWTDLTNSLAASPPATAGASLTYDPALGGLLLYGGYAGPGHLAKDTWSFVGGAWKVLGSNSTASPPGFFEPLLSYDAQDDYLLLFGGTQNGVATNQTWKFDNGSWTNLTSTVVGSPPPMAGGGGAYDAQVGAVVLFVPVSTGRAGGTSQTWEYENMVWSQVTSTATPEAHHFAGIALDLASRAMVLFGGNDEFSPLPLADTWVFQSGNWTNATNPNAPHPNDRMGCTATYDAKEGGLLLFGGYSPQGKVDQWDTWLYKMHPAPSVDARVSPGMAEAKESVAFVSVPTGGGSGPYSFVWAFGDGTFALGENVSHLYARPAFYSAVVTITDASGEQNFSSASIAVAPDPSVRIAATPPTDELGVPVNFSSAVTYGFTPFRFSWAFGDGQGATTAGAVHIYTSVGSYPVRFSLTDSAGISATATLAVSVARGLVAAATTLANPADAGFPVTFNATVAGGVAPYQLVWAFGDGALGSGAGPSHTYALPGNYTVRLAATDAIGVERVATMGEQVNPALAVQLFTNVSTTDTGTPVQLSASPSGGTGGVSVRWNFGDATTSSSLSAVHSYGQVGSYRIQLTATDGLGAVVSKFTTLVVNPLPTIHVSANLAQLVPGEFVQLSARITGGTSPFAVAWTFGDGSNSAGLVVTHAYATTGNFTATVTLTDGVGHATSGAARLSVMNPVPPTAGGEAPSAPSTSWYFGAALVVLALAGFATVIAVIRQRVKPPEPEPGDDAAGASGAEEEIPRASASGEVRETKMEWY